MNKIISSLLCFALLSFGFLPLNQALAVNANNQIAAQTNVASPSNTDIDPLGSNTCVVISKDLRYQMTDANTSGAVSMLQDFLQANGYLLSSPTGYFGLLTVAAVKKFQAAKNITPTGFVGPLTREKIKTISCSGLVGVMDPAANGSSGQTLPGGSANVVPVTPGCTAGAKFNSMTGARCDAQSIPTTQTSNGSGNGSGLSTVAGYTFNRNLEIGSMGADVVALQTVLEAKGYLTIAPGIAKGIFDMDTKLALIKFQNAIGIYPADGYFGPTTRSGMMAIIGMAPVVTPPTPPAGAYVNMELTLDSRGTDVVTLQQFLKAKGLLAIPDGGVMGYFGPNTQAAVIAYQTMKGIVPASGVVGPLTRAALNADIAAGNNGGTVPTVPTNTLNGITVTLTNTNQYIVIGNLQKITWNSQPGRSYGIHLEDENGFGQGTILASTKAYEWSTSYVWKIGDVTTPSDRGNISSVAAEGKKYRIRVVDLGIGMQSVDRTSSSFFLLAGGTTYTGPENTQNQSASLNVTLSSYAIKPGDAIIIKWTSTSAYLVQNVKGEIVNKTDGSVMYTLGNPMPGNGTYTWTSPVSLAAGTYWLRLSAPMTQINQNFTVDPGAPSLAKTDIKLKEVSCAPAEPKTNEYIRCTVYVMNTGTVDITKSFDVNVQGTVMAVGVPLAVGQTKSVSVEHAFLFSQPGTYSLNFLADSSNVLAESDETNNVVSKTFNVTLPPPPFVPNCPNNVVVDGITYTLSTCSINVTMTDGAGDKPFTTSIMPSDPNASYGFSFYGYGEGLPTYSILGGASSGGARGVYTFEKYFKDSVLNADGDNPKTYTGYVPIKIYTVSAGSNDKTLYMNVSVTVNPAAR